MASADPQIGVAIASRATLAAAAGWLGARALIILGDRSFLERAVHYRDKVSVDFVSELERAIRAACERAGKRPPELAEFFRPEDRRTAARHPWRTTRR